MPYETTKGRQQHSGQLQQDGDVTDLPVTLSVFCTIPFFLFFGRFSRLIFRVNQRLFRAIFWVFFVFLEIRVPDSLFGTISLILICRAILCFDF